MTEQTPVPAQHPMMIAWEAYSNGPEYQNSAHWAVRPEHTKGSMWAAFVAGWRAATRRPPEEQRQSPGSDGAYRLQYDAGWEIIRESDGACVAHFDGSDLGYDDNEAHGRLFVAALNQAAHRPSPTPEEQHSPAQQKKED